MEEDTIQIAALGRPLHPGMLYDCRNDAYTPGISLWDPEAIKNNVDVKPQPLTHFNFGKSDSLSEKTKLMDIGASLKASFIAGLVKVGGSGSYLNDTLSSMRQCRATIHYKQTTEFKELTVTHLGKVIYPEVFDQKSATHVVTGVLYGVEVFMVFDQMASNEEDKKVIQGNLDSSISKIPKVDVSSSGKLKLTDTEMKKVQKFSCTFHGDLALENNPTTYEEAVQLYKNLPELMGDGSEAVPMKVWLYPLTKLDKKATQLVTKIGVDKVALLEARMGQLQEAQMRADDVIQRSMKHVCIYNFTSLKKEEPYISNLSECLDSEEFKKMQKISVAQKISFEEEAQPWFKDQNISAAMRVALCTPELQALCTPELQALCTPELQDS
ncbi:cytolytic toxin-beta-like [Conger conger]|uniref:cytolytic toxin-beta-like n=1 Tax=Conger conger TaxID=82655 RepID=UPI002A59C5C3|nr:cytolytic toxin-beta-like [Conger conger]